MEKSPRQKVVLTPGKNTENTSSSNKKILRRDMERQRRQEMANLNASLRSLLPLEYVKVKKLNFIFFFFFPSSIFNVMDSVHN